MNNMLFEDFITIQGHRFLVMIDHNGVAEWDDHEGRVGRRSPGDSQLELQTAAGDAEARRRLANEFSEFTVRTKLDPVTLEKFKEWEPIHDANFSTDQQIGRASCRERV